MPLLLHFLNMLCKKTENYRNVARFLSAWQPLYVSVPVGDMQNGGEKHAQQKESSPLTFSRNLFWFFNLLGSNNACFIS